VNFCFNIGVNLFLPEEQMEAWALEEKVDLKDRRLVIAGEPQSFPLVSAVYFEKLDSGEDEQALLGRVKTTAQLVELKVEQMGESAIIGETAYRVQPGYVITVEPSMKAEPKPPSISEADLLAAFILDKL